MSDTESLSLPADEVGFKFDETCDVAVPQDVLVRPGTILAICRVLPPPDGHIVCKPTRLLDGMDEDYECCVVLTDEAHAVLFGDAVRGDGYRAVKVAPVKPVETVVVRHEAGAPPIQEGTLLARSARSSGLHRLVVDPNLGADEVLYVAAESPTTLVAAGSVRVRAHRVARALNGLVVGSILPGLRALWPSDPPKAGKLAERDFARMRGAATLLKSATRQPAAPDALPPLDELGGQEVVEVLMLNGEAERSVKGTVIVPRDVRFYEGRRWHVYERQDQWNEDRGYPLVVAGEETREAPEGYMRVVQAVGTLPPEPPGEVREEPDEEEHDVREAPGDEDVWLLEQTASPEAPPRLVQTEAADVLVAAMRGTGPRRTRAMKAARRLLANENLSVHVLARITAGLAQQGDKPEVASSLARSESPVRRAAAAFLLPVEHLPFLTTDPNEAVRQAAHLATRQDRTWVHPVVKGNFVAAVKAIILRAAKVDDDSALDVLASLWSDKPEPPERIEEAMRALELSDQDGLSLSGIGEEEAEEDSDDVATLARLWSADVPEGSPLPNVDDNPTELDPLADLREVANIPRAAQEVPRRNAIPLRDFTSKGPRTPKATPFGDYGTPEAENTHAIIKRATLRAIQQLECAVCGSRMTRTLDPRQVGACPIGHEWVNYRCTKDPSHLVVDRPEPMTYKADPDEEQAARPNTPRYVSIFDQLGWPHEETVAVVDAKPSHLRNTLLLRVDWRQEGGVVIPVCREAVAEELPPKNIEDLWVGTGTYAKSVNVPHYVRAVNIAARPHGEPSILDAIDRTAIRDDLGWAEQLTAMGIRVPVSYSRLDDPRRWPLEDIEQRGRIMQKVSEVMREVVLGEPVGQALGYLADLHGSWFGLTQDVVVIPEDARVESNLLLRCRGWRQAGLGDSLMGVPACAVAYAADFEGSPSEAVQPRALRVATGDTLIAQVGNTTLRLARVHVGGDLGPDAIEKKIAELVNPRGRVKALRKLGLVVREDEAETPITQGPITPQEHRAMDEVFGAETLTTSVPPDPSQVTMQDTHADLERARRQERARSVGFGPESEVGWAAYEDQGMSVPNPEVRTVQPARQVGGPGDEIAPLPVLSLDEIPDGDDGPLGPDPEAPEVERIRKTLWGDDKEIVSTVADHEAERAERLVKRIDGMSPEEVARRVAGEDPPTHHARVPEHADDFDGGPGPWAVNMPEQDARAVRDLAERATRAARAELGADADDEAVFLLARGLMDDPEALKAAEGRLLKQAEDAEDAHTFALIDKTIEDVRPGPETMQRQVLAEKVEAEEREVIASLGDEEPSKAGQQMQDAVALLAGTGASS